MATVLRVLSHILFCFSLTIYFRILIEPEAKRNEYRPKFRRSFFWVIAAGTLLLAGFYFLKGEWATALLTLVLFPLYLQLIMLVMRKVFHPLTTKEV